MKALNTFIVWTQIVLLAVIPAVAPISSAVAGTEPAASIEANSGQTAGTLAQQIFDELEQQSFVLSKPTGAVLGVGEPFDGIESWLRRNILRSQPNKVEVSFRYADRPGDLADTLSLYVQAPSQLATELVPDAAGRNKLRIRFQKPGHFLDGSYALVNPEHFNIVSFAEHDNTIVFLNEDGCVYGVDRSILRRQFGRSDVKFFRIGRVKMDEAFNYEVRLNVGPFSSSGLDLAAELTAAQQTLKIDDGALLFIRKPKTPAGSPSTGPERRELFDYLSSLNIYRAMAVQMAGQALATSEEKVGVSVSLLDLQADWEQWLAANPDYFNWAKAEPHLARIRSMEVDAVNAAFKSLQEQFSYAQENKSFSLQSWFQARELKLSPTSQQMLLGILGGAQGSADVLGAALGELRSELERQRGAVGDLPDASAKILWTLVAGGSASQKCEKIASSFSDGPSQGLESLLASWAAPEESVLSEASAEVLKVAFRTGRFEVWSPDTRILVAALFELDQRIEHFLIENPLFPHKKSAQKIRDSLAELRRTQSPQEIDNIVNSLEKLQDDSPQFSLLDAIAKAHLGSNSSFSDYASKAVDLHPKFAKFSERVSRSKFMKFARAAQSSVFSLANLTFAVGAGMVAAGVVFGEHTEYRNHALLPAMLYQFGLLQMIVGAYFVAGKYLFKSGAAMGMSRFGNFAFGKLLSFPVGMGLAKLLGQMNFAYAAKKGLFPTTGNGGIVTSAKSEEGARKRLLETVEERNAQRAQIRNAAVRSVLRANGIPIEGTTWRAIIEEWNAHTLKQKIAGEAEIVRRQREALLTADPTQIAEADSQAQILKLQMAMSAQDETKRIEQQTAVVAGRLYDWTKKDLKKEVFADGLGSSAVAKLEGWASKEARDVVGSEKQPGLSGIELALKASLYQARMRIRHGETYFSAKMLTFPGDVHQAAMQAVIREDVAQTIFSTYRMDFVQVLLLDALWNGMPLDQWYQNTFHKPFPSRANMSDAEELFGQKGAFLRTHPDESTSLMLQHWAHGAAGSFAAQSELGSGRQTRNLFNRDEQPPAAEKFLPPWQSFKRFTQNALSVRKNKLANYFQARFRNVGLLAQPSFLGQAGFTLLLTQHPLSALPSQYLFSRGVSMWWFGWPWGPLQRGSATLGAELSQEREAFLGGRSRFLAAVDSHDLDGARAELISIRAAFVRNGKEFTPIADIGTRTVESLTEADLKQVARFLESTPAPTAAQIHPIVEEALVGGVGGIMTTLLGVPFFVLTFSSKISKTAKILYGTAGLALYPIVSHSLKTYERLMLKYREPKVIKERGEAEAVRLADQRNYSLEVSARLLQQEKKELAKAPGDPERLAISEAYRAARARLELRRSSVPAEAAPPSSGGGSGTDCGGALRYLRKI